MNARTRVRAGARARPRRATPADDLAQRPEPRVGGPLEQLEVERASASPRLTPATSTVRRPRAAKGGPAPVAGPLRALQRWFAGVIMHPHSVAAGVRASAPIVAGDGAGGLERVVVSSGDLSALARMGIYHYAYHARLIDCLADDFPTVVHALGQQAFTRLAREIITRYPSDHPNLNVYGQRLVRHCQDPRTRIPHRRFIAELADIEWAMCEVLHAQAAPTLSQAALRAIPLPQWGRVRFRPSQTLRVLRTAYPVNRFLQAYRDERQPGIPAPQPSATAIYRQGFTVWRMDLTMPMCDILDALCTGRSLATALSTLEEHLPTLDQSRLIAQVMAWFREWVEGGFFAAFTPGRPRQARRRSAAAGTRRR